jgi:hypothetical protein
VTGDVRIIWYGPVVEHFKVLLSTLLERLKEIMNTIRQYKQYSDLCSNPPSSMVKAALLATTFVNISSIQTYVRIHHLPW